MRALTIVTLVAACKAAPAPVAIENHAADAPGPTCPEVRGRVVDTTSGEPAIGATIVLEGGAPGEDVVITDEHGQFTVPTKARRTKLVVYFMEMKAERPITSCDDVVVQVAPVPQHGPIVVW